MALKMNTIGGLIRVTVRENGVPYSLAGTACAMKFRKPDGTTFEVTPTFETDGTDGVVRYITVANDIDQYGPWSGQIDIAGGGTSFHTEWFNFQVGENIVIV